MNHAKNQHYVPQFLLKNFASRNKSFIWAYDKFAKTQNWSFVKERAISKSASEEYFYDQIKSDKDTSFEYRIGEVEKFAAPIIERIIQNQSLKNLSEIEKEILSFFIAIQFVRTKHRQKKVEEHSLDFDQKLKEAFDMEIEPIEHRMLWFSIFDAAKEFSKAICNKVWFLGKSEKQFYISDNPVVLQNTVNVSTIRGTLGLDSYGIEIYCPLSDSIILCMCCEKILEYKYGVLDLEQFDYQNIINVNSLQFFQSERFIFSSANNFEMIEKEIDI